MRDGVALMISLGDWGSERGHRRVEQKKTPPGRGADQIGIFFTHLTEIFCLWVRTKRCLYPLHSPDYFSNDEAVSVFDPYMLLGMNWVL